MYRVVIVDDSPEFLMWLRLMMDVSGEFRIVGEASSGKEAYQLVKELTPDLVISDVYMPEMDGLQLARCIRKHFPGVKVILVSIHEDRVYERLANEEGAVAFIPKVWLSLNAVRQSLQEAV